MSQDKLTRIAIVSTDKCKPKRCRQECKKSCPVVRMGKLCIEVTSNDKIAYISEELCIGCGICAKKCPFEAISIINLPSNLERDTTHRYSANSFKLHRLPMPRPGEVLGLVGTNGIGKSTALKILAGKQKPNLGRFNEPPDWTDILTYFRGSELQNYFTKILEDDLKAIIKPQYVDQIPKAVTGTVQSLLDRKDDTKTQVPVCKQLDLLHIRDRNVLDLSGGELQRFACAVVCIQNADIFMFDEPSSYLDVKQRLKTAVQIRNLLCDKNYVIVVEHDLSVLDYLSDFICVLYGVPGAYGVVTMPFSVREGINIFLDGFVPTENLRFRESSLIFKVSETADEEEIKKMCRYRYPEMTKKLGKISLTTSELSLATSELSLATSELSLATSELSLATSELSLATSEATSELSLATSELSLATSELSLATSELSLATSELLLATSELSLATSELSLATSELLLATSELLLATSELLLATSQLSLATSATIASHQRNYR
ncbi:ATP-binding cassette sub-family E member 1-like [Saccoglossus kowalevskii]|uniref:ATP-binding cassette sub-family E member 1-like n=1 Tax=Saccoglossus kowalevskii TaxID=10224 RepID=A0ABM0M799_SACKO|nr:PREDICTED: ATP-binding cassette sub-family E member 1-like [Saccoglossus kowalevskii]